MPCARILEQWDVEFPATQNGDRWFLDWALRRPVEVSRHLTCGYLAYAALAGRFDLRINTVSEYFGGAGLQTLMIRNLFSDIEKHTVADVSEQSCNHITSLFKDSAHLNVVCHDAYAVEGLPNADLIGFDAGDMTIHTLHNGKHHDILRRIFAAAPSAIVLTDIAGPRLPLHRQRYGKLLECVCDTYFNYLQGLMCYLRRNFGYAVIACYYSRWSAVMASMPEQLVVPTLIFPQLAPDIPAGLVWRN